jgi:hypothetical protein
MKGKKQHKSDKTFKYKTNAQGDRIYSNSIKENKNIRDILDITHLNKFKNTNLYNSESSSADT